MSKSDNYKKYKNISFVVSVSCFSNRFGSNKLFYKINGVEIYKLVASKCIQAIEILKEYEIFKNINMVYNSVWFGFKWFQIKIFEKWYKGYKKW